MKLHALVLFALVVSLSVFGAGDELPPPTGRIVDYTEVQAIFDKRCVECHEGDNAPGALNLIDTRSYNLIFDEPSFAVPSIKRVVPGNAAKSFLFQKINTDTLKDGSRMPIGFRLPVEEQVAIRDWINQGARPVNRNPVIDAGPTLSVTNPRAGEGIRFTASASDSNNDPLAYAWDFGDGGTATGASVVHTYAGAGVFTATVTVTDGRNGVRVGTVEVTVSADIDTDGDGVLNLADADDDGDGFSDGTEVTAQSDPLNAASTPLGGSSVTPQTLTVGAFKAKFDFKKPNRDSLSAKLLVPLPDGFNVSGQSAIVDLGGVIRPVTFDPKGASVTATDSMKLKIKKLKTGGIGGDIAVKLKASVLAETFLGLQRTSEPDVLDEGQARAFSVFMAGGVFSATPQVGYKRKKGGAGSSVLVK